MKKLLVAILMVPAVAHAGFLSGNKLYDNLISDQTAERLYALGYVTGVHDALEQTNHCSPSNVTAGQVRDVVRRYFDQNPEFRNFDADILIRVALSNAWPCAKNKSSKKGA